MASVRSWMGVSAFDREALRVVVKSCVEASRVREDLADIINIAIEELLRKRFELNQLEERGRAADKSFPDNRYLRFEKGEPILTPVQAASFRRRAVSVR